MPYRPLYNAHPLDDFSNSTTESQEYNIAYIILSSVYILLGILMVFLYACVLWIHGTRKRGGRDEAESSLATGSDFQKSNSLPPVGGKLSSRRETVA